MAESNDQRRKVTFGPYEVDYWSQELRKQGVRLRIGGQPFQIIRMLLERPGELVTREELRSALWPSDTFVDFEHGLSAATNKLRRVLSDEAENPRYIETVPRRGYRFIAQVDPVKVTDDSPAALPLTVKPRRAWPKTASWTIFATSCVLAAVFIYSRTRIRIEPPAMTIVPFTSYPGFEVCPAFSPDGSRIVFAWNGHSPLGHQGFDLYVKVLGSENLLRLTHQPSLGLCATWSPDGTQIAFIRYSGRPDDPASLRVVPSLGGPEKELLSIPNGAGISMPPVWSPDGKWIAFGGSIHRGDPHWLHLLSVDSLEVKEIPHAKECAGENWPAWSHSGEEWTYLCLLNAEEQEFGIYRAAWPGGPPPLATLVTRFRTYGRPGGIAWAAKDHELLLSRVGPDTKNELDEVSLSDGSLRQIPAVQGSEEIAISTSGDKLAYVAHTVQHIGISRRDLLNPKAPPVDFAPSTRRQEDPQYSPDGKHVVFTSSREGHSEIWMSDSEGANLTRLSNIAGDESATGSAIASDTGWPRWSPDSQNITFSTKHSGRWELYTVDIDKRMPRKLVCNVPGMLVSTWSHDGKWVYFQGDDEKVYRCPASGGSAEALSAAQAFNPWESFDGKTLYFVDRLNDSTIKMVPLRTHGVEAAVPGMPRVYNAGSWVLVPLGIYFVPIDAPHSLSFYDFATRKIRSVLNVDKFISDPSVSPDGRWVLFTQLDEDNTDIMLVHNFR